MSTVGRNRKTPASRMRSTATTAAESSTASTSVKASKSSISPNTRKRATKSSKSRSAPYGRGRDLPLDCSAARPVDPTYDLPPQPDNPNVLYIDLNDPCTHEPCCIVRLWPMSATWNDFLFNWFFDILDLNRQMVPAPKDLRVLQASNGVWLPIATLESGYKKMWKSVEGVQESNEEKFFAMEGARC
ncbi:hypothetical protein BDP27DRAFT_1435386 [Rhodocollybia butyracea]|uniref:Uncharacterized protein n=1 Tax=Rhodocollybia butyracea TaxID=206335 RepID=A0A9P5P523_9AGAR|nr:hypothetical protein BDP27DRAFT_1435386 [Rhodocollybia butyracea]